MLTLALIIVQVAPAPTDGAERLLSSSSACPAGPSADGTIVVCGRPNDQRLHPLPRLPDAKPFDPAVFRLPGIGTARVHAIQSELPGAVGQGVAVTLSVPFRNGKTRE